MAEENGNANTGLEADYARCAEITRRLVCIIRGEEYERVEREEQDRHGDSCGVRRRAGLDG